MADWREIAGDQNLRLAQKMLDQQGEINRLTAELAEVRAELQRAQPVLDAASDLAAAVHNGGPYHVMVGRMVAAVDTYLSASGSADGMPEPCQPIGCDNGHHLPGCVYAAADAEEAEQV